MNEKSEFWRSGFHCGHLISKPICPYIDPKQVADWEEGFLAGREDLIAEHQRWLVEKKLVSSLV